MGQQECLLNDLFQGGGRLGTGLQVGIKDKVLVEEVWQGWHVNNLFSLRQSQLGNKSLCRCVSDRRRVNDTPAKQHRTLVETDDVILPCLDLKELHQAGATEDVTTVVHPIKASEWEGAECAYPVGTYLWGVETTPAQIGHLSIPRSSSSF